MYKCLGFQLLIKWQTLSTYMAKSVSHIEQHVFIISVRYWVCMLWAANKSLDFVLSYDVVACS